MKLDKPQIQTKIGNVCLQKHKLGIRREEYGGRGKEILRLFAILFAGKDQRQKKEIQKQRRNKRD